MEALATRTMNYGITSRDYLKRVKKCLNKNEQPYLFYAAFEIRCGVEARMNEYLEVQQHISKKKKQGWRVAKLARNIEYAFRLGDKVAILKIINHSTGIVELEVKYTPVRHNLRKKVEKLGNYLHSAKKHHDYEHAFWLTLRSDLDDAISELEWSTSGRLLGPLIEHTSKNSVKVMIEFPTEEEKALITRYTAGTKGILQVDYE